MTTKKFTPNKLPYPKYTLELGQFDLTQTQDLSLGFNRPIFFDHVHYVEARKEGNFVPGLGRASLEQLITTSVVLEQVRPELFLRRDFIAKFVDRGKIYLTTQEIDVADKLEPWYYLNSSGNNVLTIAMNEKQYRRFGLVAKRIAKYGRNSAKMYKIEIDLRDERIKKSNKFQDKLVKILKRLNPVNKVYFRWQLDELAQSLNGQNCNYATVKVEPNTDYTESEPLDFFNYVIKEYAIDGFKPIPLGQCYLSSQKIKRSWTNYHQPYPDLRMSKMASISDVVDVLDWLGYQLLEIDCGSMYHQRAQSDNDNDNNRMDVTCSHLSGTMDIEHVEKSLWKMFNTNNNDHTVLRALILYYNNDNNNDTNNINNQPTSSSTLTSSSSFSNNRAGVFLVQDCALNANIITVVNNK